MLHRVQPSQTNASTKESIRREAQALGFGGVGFARADESPHAGRLRAWLEAGRHGTMHWIARDPGRRSDPRAVLSGARTVISVTVPYYRGGWPSEPNGVFHRTEKTSR